MTLIGGKYGNVAGKTYEYLPSVSRGDSDDFGAFSRPDSETDEPPGLGSGPSPLHASAGRGILGVREVRPQVIDASARAGLDFALRHAIDRVEERYPSPQEAVVESVRVRWVRGVPEVALSLRVER